MMRKACVAGGLIAHELAQNIRFVNEAEAATHEVIRADGFQAKKGAKFAVLDCGGGTADMTFLELVNLSPVRIREISRPIGAPAGATRIDRNFTQVLETIFGRRFEKIKQTPAFADLMLTFEDAKISFQEGDSGGKVFRFSQVVEDYNARNPKSEYPLSEFASDVQRAMQNNPRFAQIGVRASSLTIPMAMFREWFDSIILEIIELLNEAFENSNTRQVSTVYLVGGFSQSEYVFSKIKAALSRKGIQLIRPDKPDVAIVMGAVRAQLAEAMSVRCAQFNYGIITSTEFDESKNHDKSKMRKIEGKDHIDIFDLFVRQGSAVPNDYETEKKPYIPLTESQKIVSFKLAIIDSESLPNLVYADDRRISIHSEVKVPVNTRLPFNDRTVYCQLRFRGVPEIVLTNSEGYSLNEANGLIIKAGGW
eukprot:c9843_g1_i6.p1 GENE.c9843_g1_i6~~c9843_g1_i6.p1  ORF type:complete len:422 (-),score=94.16 c9843_g1_i6:64-1329(-)